MSHLKVNYSDNLRSSIINVLKNDGKPMPLNVLRHKVFLSVKKYHKDLFIDASEFDKVLSFLIKEQIVGCNQYQKYFIDYLDYEETGVEGEGYLEVDEKSGNGYITNKKHKNEYKKSSYFVHKKNLNGAKTGDYVKFCELKITNKKQLLKFALIDAKVKEILFSSN